MIFYFQIFVESVIELFVNNLEKVSIYTKNQYTAHKLVGCLPMVGIVVTISPNFSLYNIVVLPAASNPTINILISFLPKRPLNRFANTFPIFVVCYNSSSGLKYAI